MEFLTTYGWAILAVLLTIAALAYFGVVNPSRFLPESCSLFPGVGCVDATVTNADATFAIRNGLGKAISYFSISVPGCGNEGFTNGILDGELKYLDVPCVSPDYPLKTNNKFKSDLSITYVTSGGISHTKIGSLVSKVQNNYVKNGGFELAAAVVDTSAIPYWVCNSEGTSHQIYTLEGFKGRNALRHQSATGSDNCISNDGLSTADYIPYTTGKSYTMCGSFKLLSGSVQPGTTVFGIPAYNAAGTILDAAPVQAVTGTPTSSWQTICTTRTTYPGTTAKLRAYVGSDTVAPSGAVILIDEISITDA